MARLYPPPLFLEKDDVFKISPRPMGLLLRLSLEPGRVRVLVFGSRSGLWSILNSLVMFTFAGSILALWYGYGMRDRMICSGFRVVETCVLAL